ncbi:MAG: hypothetical protein HFF44_08460 [Lawsonibacter sp.]|nr:hypothetical protein [Lawsonibacter sp.]
MADFEEQLNSILGNQEAMSQIMSLARSLSGPPAGEEQEEAPPPQEKPDLSALLGQMDPKMLQLGMDVLRETRSADDRSAALLNALRPFLREERQARLDRALQIVRMTRVIRAVLNGLGGEEGERV